MSQIPNDPELTGIESALGGLIPVSSGLDRDRLMFRAGALSAASSRRARWAWPSVAAMLSLVVACESVFLAARPAPRVIERVVVVHEPAPTPMHRADSSPPIVVSTPTAELPHEPHESLAFLTETPDSESRRLQAMVLRFGLDAFPGPARRPTPSGGPAVQPDPPPATAGDLRRIELEKILNLGDRS